MKIFRIILLILLLPFLEYCSTELAIPDEYHGIPYIDYDCIGECYLNNQKPGLCKSISGKLSTIGETGNVRGYALLFNFNDFTIEITLNKKEEENFIYGEFTADSKYLTVKANGINYNRVDGILRITEYTRNCIDDFFCTEYYITPRGVFEFNFVSYGEDGIEGTEDDVIFYFKKGAFYPH